MCSVFEGNLVGIARCSSSVIHISNVQRNAFHFLSWTSFSHHTIFPFYQFFISFFFFALVSYPIFSVIFVFIKNALIFCLHLIKEHFNSIFLFSLYHHEIIYKVKLLALYKHVYMLFIPKKNTAPNPLQRKTDVCIR